MTPDLLIGLFATALVVGFSVPFCFGLCWLMADHGSEYAL